MRYKALSLFSRGHRPPETRPTTPRRPSGWADWPATILMVLGLPALLVPLLIALAGSPSLSITPNGDPPGTSVQVTGSNLPAHMRGSLLLDGSSSPLANFRTDRAGSFTLKWTIPAATTIGSHTLAAIGPIGKGSGNQRAPAPSVLASATLTVVSGSATPTPSPTLAPTPTPTARPTASPTPTPRPTPTPTPRPTPTPTPAPATGGIDHVFVIVMENHSYSEVWGTSATPYTNSLVATWAHASNYFAITHPSLPNYLDLYAGSNHGITTDCNPSSSCHISGTSLGDELSAKGLTWKGYFDGMPANCTITDSGTYRAHHDPLIYFDDMWQNIPVCSQHVVTWGNLATDLASAATTPNFAFVKPDNCHDTHDCSIATGDTWLGQTIPTLLTAPACTVDKCLVVLTWDEDDGSQGNKVLTVFAGSGAKTPYTDVTTYNHYGLLRTIEDIFGVAYQANDATATSMRAMLR